MRLIEPNSCAMIYFRNNPNSNNDVGGYVARVCEKAVYVGVHRGSNVSTTRTMSLADNPIQLDRPVRIAVTARGEVAQMFRENVLVGEARLTDELLVDGGKVVLGVYNVPNARDDVPYEVVFSDIKIWQY